MKSLLTLLPIFLLTFATSAGADIYTYTDANGVVHYSNAPDNKKYRVVLAAQRDMSRPELSGSRILAGESIREQIAPIVQEAALAYQIDESLLHAVISAESSYNPAALSNKGAAGLMQLMPDTARRFGVADRFDPKQNIHGGAQYLSHLLHLFGDNRELALAAYNAGENAVIRHGYKIPPYRETRDYVPKVLKLQKGYRPIL